MRLKVIFGVCLLFLETNAIVKKEPSKIDSLRQALLEQGDDLHPDYLQNNGSVYNLVKVFKVFGDKADNAFPSLPEQHLDTLNSVWLWARTQIEMRRINALYMKFRQMQLDITDKNGIFPTQAWVDFAKTVIHDPNLSIPRALEHIADYIVNQNLFVSAYQEASSQICNLNQSPQQLLYNLYNTIALTEIKGYTMMQFSLTLLKLYENGSFTEEMEQLKREYAVRTSETLRAVKTAMAFAPRDLWKCDPAVYKSEETYTELKQLFQGYIVNEVDLNDAKTCKENCGYYTFAKQEGCYQNQFCSQQKRCNGKIRNCQYVDSDMWICPSIKNSSRRYEYIEYENGQMFGRKNSCPAGTTKVDSWWRWLFWHCSYCFCYCDDHNTNSDRYFNLRNVLSDIGSNKVVIGVRLKKVNKIIHIQIKEGKLLPHGTIDPESISWKPIEDYTILDRNVKDGTDYHTITWDKRAVDLDDLVPPPDHLLTGLRFKLLGVHLNLEIHATPFNFTAGTLMKEKSQWYANDNTDANEGFNEHIPVVEKRTELMLEKPDIPSRLQSRAVPDSRSNQYLHFAPTDLEKDAGQSTIPFLDIQSIEPKPPVPIAGAGIFHKGQKGSGGFVALKLITYNFSRHLQVDLSPPKPVIGLSNEITSS
ncbi:uncharacterized protein LOC117177907 isoform X2 [Belonocnema kinseyi]|uniref:uncharacterized protein LOC117177907 isoform X2 n=1 Tax=Belonocnema kinseyi TaxID=2817044 RepID=UPI00143CE3EF|nr:uncharacterized protein LOC117177907 isoform X2 [Belonocnema kinseyi]XP_033224885.1 uncharacterized protein LOC117177907 isoform X2 [Belonocnema kinseyi]XP_033224886.1 uncharacterized protein LOC117177907 isoform X2 [Belonocnema kinseyi]XP_033224887.1 uncharacterized protein LOC117177907 isoform X2 [Belonocnema kinseyi]XP_033224888.1 uncharacterized protein LOC117177907 isoform X2 [Belonocnema kinseyi]XP_033224889.1 uncharacterized protein LOC117177907 isoform X2 [Belonocnema kinseyi]XP_03